MGRKTNQIKIIGLTGKGNFPSYIAVGILSTLAVWASDLLPYRSDQYLLFSVPVGVIAFLSAIWHIRKSNSYIKHILQISVSALIALLAYRSISYLLPQFSPYTEALFIFSFIFVHTLSIWNLPVATLIGDELYVPKTWVGKIVFRAILVIAPLGAIAGSLLGKAAASKNEFPVFIFGMMCLYVAFSIPFPSLSRYSKGYYPPENDELGSDNIKLTVRNPSHRPISSGKRISRNKKD
jgi:hypothetical protein